MTSSARPSWRRRILAVPTPVVFVASVVPAIVLLASQGVLTEAAAATARLRPQLLAAALLLYAVGLILLSLRWHALARMAGAAAPAPAAAEVFLTSVVVNYAAPIGLAVPTRALLSTRDLGLSGTGAGAVTLWEALLDFGLLAAIGLLWLLLGGTAAVAAIGERGFGWALVALALAGGVALALFATAAASGRLRTKLRRFSADTLAMPRRRPTAAVAALGLSVAFWALQGLVLRILLEGYGVAAPSGELLLGLLGWPVLVGMLSPVPGGAGVREALMVAVAGLAGVDGAAVLLAAVTYRVALFASLPIVFGLTRIWRHHHPAPASAEGGLHG